MPVEHGVEIMVGGTATWFAGSRLEDWDGLFLQSEFGFQLLCGDFNDFAVLQDVERQAAPGMIDFQLPDSVLKGNFGTVL